MNAALVGIAALAVLAIIIGALCIDFDAWLNGPDDHTGA